MFESGILEFDRCEPSVAKLKEQVKICSKRYASFVMELPKVLPKRSIYDIFGTLM